LSSGPRITDRIPSSSMVEDMSLSDRLWTEAELDRILGPSELAADISRSKNGDPIEPAHNRAWDYGCMAIQINENAWACIRAEIRSIKSTTSRSRR
jgi:hypothetical protein